VSGKKVERYEMNKKDRHLQASENSRKIDFVFPPKITTTAVQTEIAFPPLNKE
jgi:hypothetical protein